MLHSVYLENPATFELYGGRLAREDGAQAIRLRWYHTGAPNEVFVERKTKGKQEAERQEAIIDSSKFHIETIPYHLIPLSDRLRTLASLVSYVINV